MTAAFYYLATPYSRYRGGLDEAHRLACLAAAECFREGLLVFSPIAHTHSIAKFGGLGAGYDTWGRYDEAMMRAADGLIVVKIEGWDESEGIAAEVKWCEENGKPILFREEPQT
jgi:hypothetical protein